MEIFYLRENVIGVGQAHRDIDTGIIVPPNGHRLVILDLGAGNVPGCCAVKKGDTRYTYICTDGQEAVDLPKTEFDENGAKLAGYEYQYKKSDWKIKKAKEKTDFWILMANKIIEEANDRLKTEPEYAVEWTAYIKAAEKGKAELEEKIKTLSIKQILENDKMPIPLISTERIRNIAGDAYYASRLGRKGGQAKSAAKTVAARENAKKPRPRKKD